MVVEDVSSLTTFATMIAFCERLRLLCHLSGNQLVQRREEANPTSLPDRSLEFMLWHTHSSLCDPNCKFMASETRLLKLDM